MKTENELNKNEPGNTIPIIPDSATPGTVSKQELENTIEDIINNFHTKPEDIAEYIKFSSRFYNYSPRNTMLIYQQNPGALFCGSFKHFKDMGYSVLKGQHGMKILVPTVKTYLKVGDNKLVPLSKATKEQKAAYKRGDIKGHEYLVFKAGTVFDITQTNIPKEDYPKYLGVGKTSEHHKQLYDLLVKYCNKELDVQVRENQLQSVALRGYYEPATNDITISGTFNDTTRLSILSHEMGHAIMHKGPQLQRPAPQVEFEADCYSIMLSTHMGVEVENTRSQHLADSYRAMTKLPDFKPEMLRQSLDRAHKAYKSTVEYINQDFKPELTIKQQQLDVINASNPVHDDYHTWIRSTDDILTFEEALKLDDWQGYNSFNPDYSLKMAERAVESGKITVYSSHPIEQGTFVTPSRMEAESYSTNGKVFSKSVNLTDVAWIDPTQGMYANVTQNQNTIENNNVTQEKLDYLLKSGNVKFEHCVFDDINFNNTQGKILQASNCRFNRCNFNNFDGTATDFKESVFTDCEFRNSNFYAADLSNSGIYYTRCNDCNFTNCDLMLSKIRHSSFNRSEFSNAELINAKFDSVYFRETK